MKTCLTHRLVSPLLVVLLGACSPDSDGPPTASGPLAALHQDEDDGPPKYSDWSTPVSLGPMANSDQADMSPAISKDGLSLYIARGGLGAFDIWVSERARVQDPWGPAQDLGSTINSPGGDNSPTLSPDGRRLFFNSTRPGGFGGQDLYMSRRRGKRDNFGWRTPVNLGSGVNTSADEVQAALSKDDETGTVTLYFSSTRPGGLGGSDIYASTLLPDETFGPPVLVEELSSPLDDTGPEIRRDGLEIFIHSNRPGTLGGTDLWVAARATNSDRWSTPVNLGPVVNTAFNDGGAALSRDGTTLYFHSNANRPGATGPCFGDLGPCFFDNYVTTRSKLRGSDDEDDDGDEDDDDSRDSRRHQARHR